MLYALTVFTSAFLLFLLQPLIAKQILPWFGGTAAVWTVCLVFFQLVLLAGYAYADRLSRLPQRKQVIVHVVFLLAACTVLPIIPSVSWKPVDGSDPTWRILLLLVVTVGLPYMAVCTTGPLVQSWFARVSRKDADLSRVYRLFALSNLASLLALLAYPFAIEPMLPLKTQAWAWSIGFCGFAGLAIASAWFTLKHDRARADEGVTDHSKGRQASRSSDTQAAAPSFGDLAMWLALSAMGTVMLLTITNHITQDVASVPFLWILPLALYLLTFILCFESKFWYRRWIFWPAVLVVVPLMSWVLVYGYHVTLDIQWMIALFSIGLFSVCMFCHGELVRAKPAPEFLTQFYLIVSTGGAVGGLAVGVLAPRIFSGYWELPLALICVGVLLWWVVRKAVSPALVVLFTSVWAGFAFLAYHYAPVMGAMGGTGLVGVSLLAWIGWRRRSAMALAAILSGWTVALCTFFGSMYVDMAQGRAQSVSRNFYGVLSVKEFGEAGKEGSRRRLMHGIISHGEQGLTPETRKVAVTYYGEKSGVGLAIRKVRSEKQRIGVVGLGIGTLAAYGTPGGTIRFYEINPMVVDIAKTQFTYLSDSASTVEIALGDARLLLEAEAASIGSQQFDVLVIDAFSSDSIPLHLMTREALAVYRMHLQPNGVIAYHVSNRHLNLSPVVAQLAQDAGMKSVDVRVVNESPTSLHRTTHYRLVTNNESFLADPSVQASTAAEEVIPGLKVWTDDYNNLFKILK